MSSHFKKPFNFEAKIVQISIRPSIERFKFLHFFQTITLTFLCISMCFVFFTIKQLNYFYEFVVYPSKIIRTMTMCGVCVCECLRVCLCVWDTYFWTVLSLSISFFYPCSNDIKKHVSSLASKPINIRWIKTIFLAILKFMYSIVLQSIFNEYYNKAHKPLKANKRVLILWFLFRYPWKAVYNTMR